MVAGSDRRNWRPRRDHHAGAAALRLLIDRTGLTAGLSRALARRGFQPVHNRGRVLADAAVLITEGGRVLSDFAQCVFHVIGTVLQQAGEGVSVFKIFALAERVGCCSQCVWDIYVACLSRLSGVCSVGSGMRGPLGDQSDTGSIG